MGLIDVIATPLVCILILMAGYFIRPHVSNIETKRYFFPALIIRMISAIVIGLIYQYYYNSGDTYNFHTKGSAVITEAVYDNPWLGMKLFFSNGEYIQGLYKYTSQIIFYDDPSSYMVVKIAAFFDLFTAHSYGATSLFFSVIGFSGMWALFMFFYRRYPWLHKYIALSILFFPSVFFWGSGILKDTLTVSALGWLIFSIDQVFLRKKNVISYFIVLIVSGWIIYMIKKYILITIIPAGILLLILMYTGKVRNKMIQLMIRPIILITGLILGFFIIDNVTRNDPRYALDKLSETARVTAYDIAYWTGKDAGSTYELGELDGTLSSMFRLAPDAVNVTLFRPYVWEVSNVLMAVSSLESLFVLVLTLYMLFKSRIIGLFQIKFDPVIIFCLVFSIVFAFAVGVSTFNFGTLVRYKIPSLPFYVLAIFVLIDQLKRIQNTHTTIER